MTLVTALEGMHGGYMFAVNPDDITLLQVFRVMKNTITVDDSNVCEQNPLLRQVDVAIEGAYRDLREKEEKTLDAITLAFLMNVPREVKNERQSGVREKRARISTDR